MKPSCIALLAAAVVLAAGPVQAVAKSHKEMQNPHCRPDPSGPEGSHQLRCSIEGFGKFTIYAEAHFKKGDPGAQAQLAMVIDGHPCGKGELVPFTGRQTIDDVCKVKESGFDRHAFTVAVDYRLADYGSTHVTVVHDEPQEERGPSIPRLKAH